MRTEQTISAMEEFQIVACEPQKNNYDKLVMEAIDDVFSSLGPLCSRALYFHLEHEYNVSKNEIPAKIGEFASALEQILGSGAGLIEIEIMKRIRNKIPNFKHSPRQKSLSFSDYMISLNFFI